MLPLSLPGCQLLTRQLCLVHQALHSRVAILQERKQLSSAQHGCAAKVQLPMGSNPIEQGQARLRSIVMHLLARGHGKERSTGKGRMRQGDGA